MKEQRFKVGDQVTYKSREKCISSKGCEGRYFYGGDEHDGFVGTITNYNGYRDKEDCYSIDVTSKEHYTFSMIECEFVEYDKKPEFTHDFIVGETVYLNDSSIATILGFHYDQSRCVIESSVGLHSGDNKDYSFNQNSLYIYIPAAGKQNRKYVQIKDLKKIFHKEKPKKEHKSLVGRWVRFNVQVSGSAKVGDTFIITEDDPAFNCMDVKGYGALDRNRLVNGDCELLPEGWEQPKPIVNMLAIQEECKRLYPIGCKYTPPGSTREHTLLSDYQTYTNYGNCINAHRLGGLLYKDGKYAQIRLEMKPTMQDIQEECKRRFPIGCIYIHKGMLLKDKLKLDSSTYTIVYDIIYAHTGGGYLYADGQYSNLISVESKLDGGIVSGDLKWAALFGEPAFTSSSDEAAFGYYKDSAPKEIFITTGGPLSCYPPGHTIGYAAAGYDPVGIQARSGITHQEAIITKRVRKSNKLIIK